MATQELDTLQKQFSDLSAKVESTLAAQEKLIDAYGAGLSNLQIISAGFALLIALFVFYLGIRVEKNAVRAATEESIKQLASAREEIEAYVEEAKSASTQAQRVVTDLEGHKEVALKYLDKIKAAMTDVDDTNPKKRFD